MACCQLPSFPSQDFVYPTYLLPQTHDFETLKVAELLSPRRLLELLGVRALRPLAVHLSSCPLLLQRSRSDSAWEVLDDNAGEGEDRERSGLAWYGEFWLVGWTLNENL